MSAETSLDYNDGYLQCLNDIREYAQTNNNRLDYKGLRDEFILPRMNKCNENVGNILDEMQKHYKQRKSS